MSETPNKGFAVTPMVQTRLRGPAAVPCAREYRACAEHARRPSRGAYPMMANIAAAVQRWAALCTLALVAGCGWVDSGVGGNEPPVTASADYTLIAGETLEVGPEEGVLSDDFDVGGRNLTAEVVTEPAHASDFILNPDGSFRYTHDGSETTSDRFEYAASDQIDRSAPTPATLRILHRPQAADDTVTAEAGESVRIAVLSNDTDLDDEIVPGSVAIAQPPARGRAVPNEDGSITYTPDAGSGGAQHSFTYRVSD